MIPAFSRAIAAGVPPRYCAWSTAIGSTTATVRVGDVGGVPRAAHADLDDRHVDRGVGEGGVGHRDDGLEERQRVVLLGVDEVGVRRDVVEGAHELLVGRAARRRCEIRSVIRSTCGLVNRPVRRSSARSSVSIIREVEVLPLVPVRWMSG